MGCIIRDDTVDVLRFIGLAMIILAHVDSPSVLFQLRNFDVPLIVLISSMLFGLSYKNNTPHIKNNRMKKILRVY